MGLDSLDLAFALEKKHHLRVTWEGIEPYGEFIGKKWLNGGWDIRIGRLHAYINERAERLCDHCAKALPPGVPGNIVCPYCTKQAAGRELTWNELIAALLPIITPPWPFRSKVPEKIEPEMWLRRDLGFC